MKNLLKLGATGLVALSTFGVQANDHTVHVGGHEHQHKPENKIASKAVLADGEIRKINKNTGQITMKHGEIKSVEMPPMTMVFRVADKAMLDGLNEGDKVKFNVKQEGANYTVTEIRKAQ